MSQQLIFFIVAVALAAGGALMYVQTIDGARSIDSLDLESASPQILSITTYNISNSTANYVRIQVTSDNPVRLSDTLITLSESDTARLQYRSGTLNRSVATGFYTQ